MQCTTDSILWAALTILAYHGRPMVRSFGGTAPLILHLKDMSEIDPLLSPSSILRSRLPSLSKRGRFLICHILQAIYDLPPVGQPHLIKSEFYETLRAGFDISWIESKRNPAEHAQEKSPSSLRPPQKHSQFRKILCKAAGMTSFPKLALSASDICEKSALSAGSRWSRLVSWVRWRLTRALTVLKMVSWDWRSLATNTQIESHMFQQFI